MCRPSAWPAVSPRPGTTLKTPSGMPASEASSARRIVLSEVSSAGLMTRLLPAASAGAAFQAAIMIGKFQGRTAPTTPIGSRMIMPSASRPGRRDRVVQLVDRLGVPAERLDRLGQVRLATVRDRLARLERVEQRQLLGVRLDQVGEAQQHGLALGGGAARPAAVVEGAAGGGDREVDVGGVARGDRGQRPAGRGVLGRESLAAEGGPESAVDEGVGP